MKIKFTKEDTLVAKGVAILLLLFYHAFEHKEMLDRLGVICDPLPEDLFLLASSFGNICVAIFVSLTSYGIAKACMKSHDLKINMHNSIFRLARLIYRFFISYLVIIGIFVRNLNLQGLYGEGKQGILYGIIDALGCAELFETPILNPTWWYMELAIILILLVPMVAYCYEKIGNSILIIAVIIPNIIMVDDSIERYLFISVLGVVVAYNDSMSIAMNFKMKPIIKWIICIVLIIVSILVRQNYVVYHEFSYIVDGVIAWFIIYCSVSLLGTLRIIRNILSFIGIYSMNIYLVHTFIYMMIYQPYLYSLKYAGLIYLALLASSLILAIFMDRVVKITMYIVNQLHNKARKTIRLKF